MANPQHLKILKRGVKVWNEWRGGHRKIVPDLAGAGLSGADLDGADLYSARLSGADLGGAKLVRAYLSGADLSGAKLIRADLRGAGLLRADLSYADLSGADLSCAELIRLNPGGAEHGAKLIGAKLVGAKLIRAGLNNADLTDADLSGVDLGGANLSGASLARARLNSADLRGADLSRAELDNADFTDAKVGYTSLGGNNLSLIKGLETVAHYGPSTVGVDNLYMSAGRIPEAFLRGCGLSDWQVESAKLYQPELSNEEITDALYRVHDLRAQQAIQISPLFISYTHTDAPFVDRLETYLKGKGVRFWRDVHHSTAGRLERQIDRAIRHNPTVLLVLSERSIKSDWVEHEARLARKLELETGRDVLCPVALDDSWKTCRWPERLREQIMEYNVLDFSRWQDPDHMRRMFLRLMEGLGLFYK